MQEEKIDIGSKRRGYYSKQLAALKCENHQFVRSKKGIKKSNSEVCRESRKKKKLYIESLQEKNRMLQSQIIALQQRVTILEQELQGKQRFAKQAHSGVKDLIEEYKELMRAIAAKDDKLITRSLEVLRSRFGISGRDRAKWMQQHMMRAVELSMPMHFRLLLENCDNSKAFFQLLGGGEEMKSCRVNFSQEKKTILKLMKPKIKRAKAEYNKILEKLHEGWVQLKRYGQQSQKIIDQIQDKISHPLFIGNLLMTLDSHRTKNPTMGQIYPLNFFAQLSRQSSQYEFCEHSPFCLQQEPDDNEAFSLYFEDFL